MDKNNKNCEHCEKCIKNAGYGVAVAGALMGSSLSDTFMDNFGIGLIIVLIFAVGGYKIGSAQERINQRTQKHTH